MSSYLNILSKSEMKVKVADGSISRIKFIRILLFRPVERENVNENDGSAAIFFLFKRIFLCFAPFTPLDDAIHGHLKTSIKHSGPFPVSSMYVQIHISFQRPPRSVLELLNSMHVSSGLAPMKSEVNLPCTDILAKFLVNEKGLTTTALQL